MLKLKFTHLSLLNASEVEGNLFLADKNNFDKMLSFIDLFNSHQNLLVLY